VDSEFLRVKIFKVFLEYCKTGEVLLSLERKVGARSALDRQTKKSRRFFRQAFGLPVNDWPHYRYHATYK